MTTGLLRVSAQLEFVAAQARDRGDLALEDLLRAALDLLCSEEDLTAVQRNDYLQSAQEDATELFRRLLDDYQNGDRNAPVVPPALRADAERWLADYSLDKENV